MRKLILPAALVGIGAAWFACSGGSQPSTQNVAPTHEAVAPDVDYGQTWAVKLADESTWSHLQTPGWITFVTKRNLHDAAEQLGGKAARPHAEAATMFRQAALLSANAAIETYAKTPQDTDPVGASHLLAVAWALHGDLDKARAASAKLDGVEDVTSTWHAPWKAWLAGDAKWPPGLSALPIELPPVEQGNWPIVADAPHYSMPVQGAGDHAQDMGDPGSLVALALWHDAMARKLAEPAMVELYTARYRLPVEGPVSGTGELTEEFLYASDFLTPQDAAFMADVMGEKGAGAVAAHEGTSLLAKLAAASRVDGKVDSDRAVDVATALRQGILDGSAAKTNGETRQHHRWFADMARVGLLRNLALLAEVEGDRETGGKLRILARDSSLDHTSDASALIALGAWDAGNRYPTRAQEIIHRHATYYPSLEAARYGLDVLALRVSRERVETPGM
ncbi:MAG: hypothetical protein H6734_02735 [Alphaproteobacteria bacterium]|nr:hypothetical protein [Alphaproteobacteria bacterium]